jgi:hypothetical protein
VGADLGIYSAYVWRGLSLTNRPVLQPDLWLSLPVGGNGSITVGGWSSIDIGKYDNPTKDISEGGGNAGPDLTELTYALAAPRRSTPRIRVAQAEVSARKRPQVLR